MPGGDKPMLDVSPAAWARVIDFTVRPSWFDWLMLRDSN
jgi:hypothetical protein